ncbi:unnamed protein product [Protopolystoma xenopodis]|uniref:EF-hand domain-containing protein n=1 Tax=Protopolystoma xenopodis TaxID=117903 RepID=A0A448WS55_9PLAT|nr:unnamed protein product [Protopolystoma xenopodis]
MKPLHIRADVDSLRSIFTKYASVKKGNDYYMNSVDFGVKYLGLFDPENYNEASVNLIAGAVDTTKDGLISFEEFMAFEALLCTPDAMYATAFQIFDKTGTGFVSFSES